MNKTDPIWLYQIIRLMEEDSDAYPEQIEIYNSIIDAAKTTSNVRVIQGPTGLGKTYPYLAASLFFASQGKKTLISLPTYSQLKNIPEKTLEKVKNLKLEGLDFDYMILKGISRTVKESCIPDEDIEISYRSQFTRMLRKAKDFKKIEVDIENCTLGPDNCRHHKSLIDYLEAMRKDIVLTVHAKLKYTPWLEEQFDVVIIDESHSFENTLNASDSSYIKLDELLDIIEQENDNLLNSHVTKIRQYQQKGVEKIRPVIMRKFQMDLQVYVRDSKTSPKLNSIVNSFDRIQKYGGIFKQKNDQVGVDSYRKTEINWQGTSSVLLISATIDDPQEHINRCFFSNKILLSPLQFKDPGSLRDRFRKRPIFALYDGPNLAKSKENEEIYSQLREQANEIIISAIKAVPNEVTMILCRSGEDSKAINKSLSLNPSTKDRYLDLTEFEEGLVNLENTENLDLLETKLNEKISQGKNIITASASSKLWEGANIYKLRFIIIDALPYPSMQVRRGGPWTKKPIFRIMKNRLQQGIGRIVRNDHDFGICLIVDGRYYDKRNTIEKFLPKYISGDQIRKFISKEEIDKSLSKMHNRLLDGEKGDFIKPLDEYF